jgi:hypothetical protein
VQLVVGMAVLSFPPEILLCWCVADCVCWVVGAFFVGLVKERYLAKKLKVENSLRVESKAIFLVPFYVGRPLKIVLRSSPYLLQGGPTCPYR